MKEHHCSRWDELVNKIHQISIESNGNIEQLYWGDDSGKDTSYLKFEFCPYCSFSLDYDWKDKQEFTK